VLVAPTDAGEIFIFFGNRIGGLSKGTESEKDERIKELECLYRVLEWIEVSPSIKDFFTELPRYLSSGMLYPDEVVIYSIYENVEYGQQPSSKKYIAVRLVVGDKEKGEIRAGYLDDQHEILPEEQRMLSEIGRALNFALGRKEFRDRLTLKEGEEAEYSRRLEKLEEEIAARTKDLEAQRSKLNIVNSYLDRVSDSWEEARGRLETMFKAPLIESYGMTEAAHQMASNPLPPLARKPGTVGRAAGPEVAIRPGAAVLCL